MPPESMRESRSTSIEGLMKSPSIIHRRLDLKVGGFPSNPAGGVWRTGFTLVEILLVLAVIGVLAAVVAPVAIRRLGDATMISSADQVCRLLAEARMMAMEAGEPAEFRFEPGGNHFLVTTRTGIEDAQVGASSSGMPSPVDNTGKPIAQGGMNLYTCSRSIGGHLAAGVTFAAPVNSPTGQPMTEGISAQWIADLENASELADVRWSPAIIYRPDGTTNDGEVKLSDNAGRTIKVRLRGLTGSAVMLPMTIGEPSETSTGIAPRPR
jgi:prepilin-type N-terminal cleavage/methylation domain-containing protein